MINTEADYQQALSDISDLRSQYRELTSYNAAKPYIGQAMVRDIARLDKEVKEYENRLNSTSGPEKT